MIISKGPKTYFDEDTGREFPSERACDNCGLEIIGKIYRTKLDKYCKRCYEMLVLGKWPEESREEGK